MGRLALLRRIGEPINVHITCRSKVRKWAYENAYTLIFASIYFMVTWVIVIVANILTN